MVPGHLASIVPLTWPAYVKYFTCILFLALQTYFALLIHKITHLMNNR